MKTPPTPWLTLLLLMATTAGAGVNHAPRWSGTTSLGYGLDDLDGYAAGEYQYCRWGNWQSDNGWNVYGTVELDYTALTRGPFANVSDQNTLDVFMSRARDTMQRELFPADTRWDRPGSISFNVGWFNETRRTLFRYLHFQNTLTNDAGSGASDAYLNSSTRKLVVVCHGWNPDAAELAYDAELGAVVSNLAHTLRGTDWRLLKYRWERDSSTGTRNLSSAVNGTEAAEIGYSHGWHLGELLHSTCPNLEKIHFIAHSAGTWPTRGALRYLLAKNASVKAQWTLLDPFCPNAIALISSSLGAPVVSAIDSAAGASRIFLLENYYAAGTDLALGTQETFTWRSGDLNQRVDWSSILPPTLYYQGHGGPNEFYAHTINAATGGTAAAGLSNFDLSQYGFRRSLFMKEPVILQQPASQTANVGDSRSFSVTVNTREGRAQSFQAAGLGFQWRKNGATIGGANSAVLSLNNVQAGDAATYSVLVTNAAGGATSLGAYLTVIAPTSCSGTDNADFVSESWPYDGDPVAPGQTFVKTFTMKNNGSSTWRGACDHRFAYDGGESFGSPGWYELEEGEAVPPGSNKTWTLTLTAPPAAGLYRGYFRMDRSGTALFGDRIWVEVNVVTNAGCTGSDDADFVREGPPYDGDPVVVGQPFTKSLTLRNTGGSTWSSNCSFRYAFDGGEQMGGPAYAEHGPGSTPPGAEKTWTVNLTAPSTPGLYRGYWRMDRAGTGRFGGRVWVEINAVSPTACVDDAYEENDAFAAAFPLGGRHSLWLSTISGTPRQADEDWYALTVTGELDHLVITCRFVHAEGDLDLMLYDSQTNRIAMALGYTNTEVISTSVVVDATYYLRVFNYFTNDACNAYDLFWSLGRTGPVACANDDAYEPNDTLPKAHDLREFERWWLSSLGGAGRQGDDDWYQVEITPGYQRLVVTCEFFHADGDIDIALYDAATNRLAVSQGLTNNEAFAVTLAAGTYFLRVYYGNNCNEYDLWWDDVATTNLDLWLVGDYLALPLDATTDKGRFMTSGGEEGARFNPAGTGGLGGTDFWAHGIPIYNYTIAAAGAPAAVNGRAWISGPVLADLSAGTLKRATVAGEPLPGLLLLRDIYFQQADRAVTIVDTLTNTGAAPIEAMAMLDSLDPDQDAPAYGEFATANDVVSALAPQDLVYATATNSGMTIALGSLYEGRVPDTFGFDNRDPYQIIAQPIDADGAVADDAISLARDLGTLAPGASRSFVWRLVFGADPQQAMAGYQAQSLDSPVDGDRDGMSDGWEFRHFGTVSNGQPDGDDDQDGMPNLDEHRSGSDPTNSASLLKFMGATLQAPTGEALIHWQSASNRTYRLLRATNAMAAYNLVVTNVPATPPSNVYTDSVSGRAEAYFRIEVE